MHKYSRNFIINKLKKLKFNEYQLNYKNKIELKRNKLKEDVADVEKIKNEEINMKLNQIQ